MGALGNTHLQTACIKQVVEVRLAVVLEIVSVWFRVRPRAIDSAFLVELLAGQHDRKGQPSKQLFWFRQTARIYKSNTTGLFASNR